MQVISEFLPVWNFWKYYIDYKKTGFVRFGVVKESLFNCNSWTWKNSAENITELEYLDNIETWNAK